MSSQLVTGRLAEPPPLELDLIDDNTRFGWMTRGVIGFCGFASEAEAVYAAFVAHRALMRRLASRGARGPMNIDATSLALRRHDDAIHADDRTIATLIRPGPDSRAGTDDFGFEVELPLVLDELELRATSLAMYHALRSSGIQWRVKPSGRRT